MRESIFSASIRAFFITLFAVAGFLLSFIIIIILVGALPSSIDAEPEITYTYSPSVLPNVEGVRKVMGSDVPVILTINIKGVIGVDSLTQSKIDKLLVESRERSLKNDRVKAVLLDIDSPGGSASDSDAIYRAIKTYKEKYKIPVYAYVNGLCASGGMYIACAADKIYASDSSLIGSIGVILSTALNFSQLMDKIGIQSLTLYDGKGKDSLNPLRPWVAGEDQNIKDIIDYLYKDFVDVVTQARPNLSKEKLIAVYGANVYPAPLAMEYGYIDEHGYSLNHTLKELLAVAEISDDNYQVIELTSTNWISELFSSKLELLSGRVTHQLELPNELPTNLQNKFLYLYR